MSKETPTFKGVVTISSEAIVRAAKILGSEAALAAAIGVSKQNLHHWKDGLPSYDRAIAICVATNGAVDVDELRPDMRVVTRKLRKMFIDSVLLNTPVKVFMADVSVIKVTYHFRRDFGDMGTLMNSILECGLKKPITVSPNLILIHGERRLRAFKELKIAHIPTIIDDELSPALGRYNEHYLEKSYTEEEMRYICKKTNREFKEIDK